MLLLVEINVVKMAFRAALVDPVSIMREPNPLGAGLIEASKSSKRQDRQHSFCLFNLMSFLFLNNFYFGIRFCS